MQIDVIKERNNPLLKRREIHFRIDHNEGTPSRKSVVERIAATMNSKVGLVVVDKMKTEFGKRETIGYAKIYESEDRLKAVENTYIVARNTFNAKAEEAS